MQLLLLLFVFSHYLNCVFRRIQLDELYKEIPTLKGDNYIEWKKKIDLAFILAEVDWVVTTSCPTEPVAPVRETNEADVAWATKERDYASQKMSYDLEHRKWVTINKKYMAVIKNMIEPVIMGSILECDTVTEYLDRLALQRHMLPS